MLHNSIILILILVSSIIVNQSDAIRCYKNKWSWFKKLANKDKKKQKEVLNNPPELFEGDCPKHDDRKIPALGPPPSTCTVVNIVVKLNSAERSFDLHKCGLSDDEKRVKYPIDWGICSYLTHPYYFREQLGNETISCTATSKLECEISLCNTPIPPTTAAPNTTASNRNTTAASNVAAPQATAAPVGGGSRKRRSIESDEDADGYETAADAAKLVKVMQRVGDYMFRMQQEAPHLLNGGAANNSYKELKALSTSSSSFSNFAKVAAKISSPLSWKMIVKTIPLETLFPVFALIAAIVAVVVAIFAAKFPRRGGAGGRKGRGKERRGGAGGGARRGEIKKGGTEEDRRGKQTILNGDPAANNV